MIESATRTDEQASLVTGPELKVELESCVVGDTTILTLDGSLHLALDASEAATLRALDGRSSLAALEATYGESIADLVADLAEVGFLVGTVAPEEPSVVVSRAGFEFAGFDRVVQRVDRLIGSAVSSRWALTLGVVVAIGGLVASVVTAASARTFSATTTLAVLAAWMIASAVPHELAHALVLHRGGRRVGRAGFGMHWGDISFFVDATDALFLPKRTRLAQTLAGPFADSIVAGSLGLAAWLVAPGPWGSLLAQMALLTWISVLVNLSPLLELDGQHAIEDLLDEPDLRAAASDALRRLPVDRSQRTVALAAYALLSLVVGIALLGASAFMWVDHYLPLVERAWHEGPLGQLAAVAFTGPTVLAVLAWAMNRCSRQINHDENGGEHR